MNNHELSHILKTVTCTDHNGSISGTYYDSGFCLITSSFYKLVFLDTLKKHGASSSHIGNYTENSRARILETKKIEIGKIWKNFTMGATL